MPVSAAAARSGDSTMDRIERSRVYAPRTRRARPSSSASRVMPLSSRSASQVLENPSIAPAETFRAWICAR